MPPERRGFDLWQTDLNGARLVVAPMVEQSELAWRILSRRHRAELCYTPMLHASTFVKDARYRRENLVTCPEDQPLIVQFCANDPKIFLEAARYCVGHCAAVDLNLGCPQSIARRGHYGAFLQDEWDLLTKMINLAHTELNLPITCKMRVFESMERTVDFAKMLEKAGCQLLTVHGRTREQKGPLTGLANWEYITAVRKNVSIPVFANGNIQNLEDVERCLKETGVQGVMSAEGNLHNPALFEGRSPTVWSMAEEYLDIVKEYPCPLSFSRGHLFKLFQHCLSSVNADLRLELAKSNTIDGFVSVTSKLKDRYQDVRWDPEENTPMPPWICQPYVRPNPEIAMEKMMRGRAENDDSKENSLRKEKRPLDCHGVELSKKKMKKLARNPNKNFTGVKKEKLEKCAECHNPRGSKCIFYLCRSCCKKECYYKNRDCTGHNFLFKTKRMKASSTSEASVESSVTNEKNCTGL